MKTPPVRDLLNFVGKTAVITGAGQGIGSAIALRFAEAGADVAVHYKASKAGALALVDEIGSSYGKAIAVQADLAKSEGVQALMEATVQAFGGVDVLVNNAGTYPVTPLLEMSEAEWDVVIGDNLRTVHLCTQAAARLMIESGRGGSVVNVASIEAENPAPGHAHYCSAKAAVLMYTRSAAAELGPRGVRVNAVSPGLIWRQGLDEGWPDGVARYKAAVPLGRLGTAADVADACLFLASEAARWITGANLLVDGGVLTQQTY